MHNDEDIDPNLSLEETTLLRDLALKKGKCPEGEKGLCHKLMKLAYMPRKIETIMDTNDSALLKLFYTVCVSEAVGKRKWNECSKVKYLSSFVNPSDEAFAMLVIENNTAKWMNELCFGKNRSSNEQYKTLYTEGKSGRKWTRAGMSRFLELIRLCREYRVSEARKERYKEIEIMIQSCERAAIGGNNNNNYSSESDENDENSELEQEFLAMANGGGNNTNNEY